MLGSRGLVGPCPPFPVGAGATVNGIRELMVRSVLIVVAALASTVAAAVDQAEFARPGGLAADVTFWKRVYTEVDTRSGLIHDSRQLDVVYEVVRFSSHATRRSRARQVKKVKAHYRTVLRRLAGGKRKGLSAEESRVLVLFPEDVTNRELRNASQRLRFQLGQSDKFRAGLVRSGAWEPYIRRTLADMGLPQGLVALPHVESSFNPDAYSRVGAAGMWQFTRSTGRRYMRVDHIVDERMDPYRATVAAAQLLQHNYSVTGSWPLAITAYNHGAAGMRRAKRRLGTDDITTIVRKYRSRTFGFASRNFYVAFVAALEVSSDPDAYFGPLRRDVPTDYDLVRVPDFITVEALENSLAIDRKILRKHNRALRPPVWNGTKFVPRGFELRVPQDVLSAEPRGLVAAIPASERFERQKPDQYHYVRRGDTLSLIATRYGVSERELVELNGLRSRHLIRAGQRLRLPVPDSAGVAVASTPLPADGVYVVRRGDSVSLIARRFDMSEVELLAANEIRNRNRIYPGQRLRVAAAAPEAAATEKARPEAPVLVAAAEPEAPEPLAAVEPQAPEPVAAAAPEASKPMAAAEPEVRVAAAELPAAAAPRSDAVEPVPEPVEAERELAQVALAPAIASELRGPVVTEADLAEVEAAEPTSPEEAEAIGPNLVAGMHPAPSADPSDYTVAEDGTIEVQAAETLGHYADWLEIRTQRLRDANAMRFGKPVVVGKRLRLEFSRVGPELFEQRRQAYHREMQETFFTQFQISGTEEHVVERGEALWILALRRYRVPIWLLRQYNPDLDLDKVHPGTKVVIPLLAEAKLPTTA